MGSTERKEMVLVRGQKEDPRDVGVCLVPKRRKADAHSSPIRRSGFIRKVLAHVAERSGGPVDDLHSPIPNNIDRLAPASPEGYCNDLAQGQSPSSSSHASTSLEPAHVLRHRRRANEKEVDGLGEDVCFDCCRNENFSRLFCGSTAFSCCSTANLRELVVAALSDGPSVYQVVKSLIRPADQLGRTVSNSYAYRIDPAAWCTRSGLRVHFQSPSQNCARIIAAAPPCGDHPHPYQKDLRCSTMGTVSGRSACKPVADDSSVLRSLS